MVKKTFIFPDLLLARVRLKIKKGREAVSNSIGTVSNKIREVNSRQEVHARGLTSIEDISLGGFKKTTKLTLMG